MALGFTQFIELSLDPACPSDRTLVVDITNHYLDVVKSNIVSGDDSQVSRLASLCDVVEP